jgi:hypothetical protein
VNSNYSRKSILEALKKAIEECMPEEASKNKGKVVEIS